jgi:hypothetical protein
MRHPKMLLLLLLKRRLLRLRLQRHLILHLMRLRRLQLLQSLLHLETFLQ